MSSSKINKYHIVFLSLAAVLALYGVMRQVVRQKDIQENKKKVVGKVTDLKGANLRRFILKYEYIINNETYKWSTAVSFFKCEDGNKGCIGKKFTVYYSSKNPEYSRIYLGKYEKYKTEVEFFK